MISDTGISALAEGSDSNSSNNPFRPSKRRRHDEDNNPTSSVRFKGVVLQQNGHWGAQIYTNHQRIWLGTFKSEKEAAMAYDSAAIKLRGGDSHRNFPWTNLSLLEPTFQELHTTESVLNMIKEGTYQSKFAEYVRTRSLGMDNEIGLNLVRGRVNNERGFLRQQLFQKELTPSDVGKLNRLVIPKKYAVKYFPPVPEHSSEEEDDHDQGGSGVDDVQLVFYDKWMKSWKFRYCYWKSSQSFVFTRGWSRFVKEKKLKAKDIITFYRCERREGCFGEEPTFCMIDVEYNESQGVDSAGLMGMHVGLQLQLGLSLPPNYEFGSSDREYCSKLPEDDKTPTILESPELPPGPPREEQKDVITLFGVRIS
ncbi:PREDICTED: AP2/ERF and B3 domain-containing transcription factor At1g50680-like [Nelumbo nucifera]|uniref:AP2/ERF and B3 domain-containing transcription factor At1g50680-like n=2 Tax=Nelumbo nucifera TaxID=4432 RepID=A0A1U7ZA23_NELNU|nr:PREDICTED: AP2/ERF and B3 domain-containing transcription factor At1g50680-like [Nelumbo nucifera]DAD30528.1 TPA_asm: hypothetical protein HUJ06_009379 [Nelumbo nucifera]